MQLLSKWELVSPILTPTRMVVEGETLSRDHNLTCENYTDSTDECVSAGMGRSAQTASSQQSLVSGGSLATCKQPGDESLTELLEAVCTSGSGKSSAVPN